MNEITEERMFELEKGTSLINGKYKVLSKIGTGATSSVHAVSVIKGQKQVIRAIKVESINVKEPQIKTEISVLKSIKDNNPDEQGFAQIYEYGYEPTYNYLIMSLLGPNLQQLQRLCGGVFSLKTTMIVALQVLDRLQVLHSHGYIYGDVSPDNFLVGLNNDSPFVFMVDFGKSKRYKSRTNGQHVVFKQNVHYTYNPIFAGVNAHNNIQPSRRDDMQSLLYMIIYLKLGKLPWARHSEQKRSRMDMSAQQLKKKLTPEMLCHKMPLEIIDLVYYVRSIEFYEKPDYDFIRKLFYKCLEREPFGNNIIYDWNNLEEIDFKVYSGEPKIVLRGTTVNTDREKSLTINSAKEGSAVDKLERDELEDDQEERMKLNKNS